MLAGVTLACITGCHMLIPDVGHLPVVHNPFPQLSRVAVAPFFNQSDEPTVDGRRFAMAYFAELQAVPGFEVVPLGVVEEAILEHQVDLSHPDEARRLARILGVDAVAIGSVTDYTPYYPPRCGLRVEWYAANPGFHEIPPGYGLPWGTPEEEFIPEPLRFEAEMALAKAQLATQTPACEPVPLPPPLPPLLPLPDAMPSPLLPTPNNGGTNGEGREAAALYEEELPPRQSREGARPLPALQPHAAGSTATTGAIGARGAAMHAGLPASWPDESCFTPLPPGAARPPCVAHSGPVMTHTRIYHGHDPDFTLALANYYHFRTDARFGGWQNYLQRSDDFIRFCCHLHIAEMLSARGGAGQTRVVWHWPDSR